MSIFYARLVCRINFRNPSALIITKKNIFEKLSRFHLLSTSAVVHSDEKLLGVSYLKDDNGAVSQADNEYPDWLWQLNKHKQTIMEEFDPHSQTYRKRLRKRQRREENERRKMKRF